MPSTAADFPGLSAEERLEQRLEMGLKRREEYLDIMAEKLNKPRRCRGEGHCDGFVHVWVGQLDFDNWEHDGFEARYCTCTQGLLWKVGAERQRREQEQAERAQLLFENSNLPFEGKLAQVTISSFARTENGKQPWFGRVKRWIEEWASGTPCGLVLFGAPGVGKTGLCVAAARHLIYQQGVEVYFTKVSKFLDYAGADWEEKRKLAARMCKVQLLVIDDLGAGHRDVRETDENSPLRLLFDVFDERHDMERPILLTTNCETPVELARVIGARNWDRIKGMCETLDCKGNSLRKRA